MFEPKLLALGALTALVSLVLGTGLATPAAAAHRAQPVFQDGEGGGEDEAADADADKDDDDSPKYFAVVGGDVYTGTGAVLRGATVLSKNGKIREIGYDVYIPEDAEQLDATGYRVYPGLVAADVSSSVVRASGGAPDVFEDHAHAEAEIHGDGADASALSALGLAQDNGQHLELGGGMRGDGEGEFELDFAAEDEEQSDIADSYDPFSYRVVLILSAGITTVGSSNAAIKLKRDTIDGIVLREKYLQTFSYSSSNPSSKRSMREKLEKASQYLRDYRDWQERVKKNKDLKEPSTKGIDSKVVDVLTGAARAKFRENDREDLLDIARLAQQYGFRPVIEGCVEGWTVAEELGRAGATAIITPRMRRDKDENLVRAGGSSIENAAILNRHGVQVAVVPANNSIDMGGETGRDMLHLPIEAGFAIRGGLSEQAALASITTIPARTLGVDHRVGSLEVGKDCDLIVTDGDLLHYETFVQYAVIEGKIAYDKQEELFFRHIRPRPEPPAPDPVVEDETADDEGDAVEPDEDEGDDEGDEEGDGEGDEDGDEDGDEGDDEGEDSGR